MLNVNDEVHDDDFGGLPFSDSVAEEPIDQAYIDLIIEKSIGLGYRMASRSESIKMKKDGPELSDNTPLSGVTWGEIKKTAMKPDYVKKSTFVKYLTKREQETLDKLIVAQTNQGDLLELEDTRPKEE